MYGARTETLQKEYLQLIQEQLTVTARRHMSSRLSTHNCECGWWGFAGGATQYCCSTGWDVLHNVVSLPCRLLSATVCCVLCRTTRQRCAAMPRIALVCLQEQGVWCYFVGGLKEFFNGVPGAAASHINTLNER